MVPGEKESELEKKKRKTRDRLFTESAIEDLQKEFDLSKEVTYAAILILRIFIGLGKGLSSSQKRSFSAASVWHAAKLVEERTLSKEKLAEEVGVSSRTLARRLRELEEKGDSKIVLDYVRERIKEWSKKRERKLRDLL